jgi:hypothetical protein
LTVLTLKLLLLKCLERLLPPPLSTLGIKAPFSHVVQIAWKILGGMSIDFGELCRVRESMSTQSLLDDLYVMSGILVTASLFAIGTPFPLYHPPTFQIPTNVFLQYLVLAADFLADLLPFRERRSSVLGVCALAEMDSREKDQRLAAIRMVYCIVLYWKHCWGVSLLVQARPAILHLYNKDRPSAAKQGSICGVPARITRCDAD